MLPAKVLMPIGGWDSVAGNSKGPGLARGPLCASGVSCRRENSLSAFVNQDLWGVAWACLVHSSICCISASLWNCYASCIHASRCNSLRGTSVLLQGCLQMTCNPAWILHPKTLIPGPHLH